MKEMKQQVSKAEAYMMMSRMAQDMYNEVSYNEELMKKNKILTDKIEKLEEEIKKIKEAGKEEFIVIKKKLNTG